jgi:hypothetical protein
MYIYSLTIETDFAFEKKLLLRLCYILMRETEESMKWMLKERREA